MPDTGRQRGRREILLNPAAVTTGYPLRRQGRTVKLWKLKKIGVTQESNSGKGRNVTQEKVGMLTEYIIWFIMRRY